MNPSTKDEIKGSLHVAVPTTDVVREPMSSGLLAILCSSTARNS
jgi:hypothetical protein